MMKDNHEAHHTSNKYAIGSRVGIIFKDKDKGNKGHKDKGHGSESSNYLRKQMKDFKEGIRLMRQRERPNSSIRLLGRCKLTFPSEGVQQRVDAATSTR